MGAAMAAPYVGGYIVMTPEEMNNLVAVGAQVARWYDWPDVMNERVQDHMALVMLVGVIGRGHYQQFLEMQARKRPVPMPEPVPDTEYAGPLPTPEEVEMWERERAANAAN